MPGKIIIRLLVLTFFLTSALSCQKEETKEVSYGEELNLFIPASSEQILDSLKNVALQQELITQNEKKYVPAGLVVKGDTIPIDIRLKGDQTDHLVNEKISYRIKLPKNIRFYNCRTFSIQHPKTRNYVHEYFMHQLFKREALLTTQYDFCPVIINGEDKGVYAFEGHFDEDLLAHYGHIPGPIIKFDETAYWTWMKNPIMKVPMFDAYPIAPFKKKSIIKDSKRLEEFSLAANLAEYYRHGHLHADEIFDLEKTARYWALLDFGNIKHSRIHRNQRFYYNPTTAQLEFIGFDMLAAANPDETIMAFDVFKKGAKEIGYFLEYSCFINPEFRSRYTYYLNYYSSDEFVDGVEEELLGKMKEAEAFIQTEEADYVFDFEYYRNHAKNIQEQLKDLDKSWDEFFTAEAVEPNYHVVKPYDTLKDKRFFEPTSVSAYTYWDGEEFVLQLENYHQAVAKVYAYKLNEDSAPIAFEDTIILSPYVEVERPITEIGLHFKPEKILFGIDNDPDLKIEKEVYPWRRPREFHPRIELKKSFKLQSPYYTVESNHLTFLTNCPPITELIYIPEQFEVHIAAGTELQFKNGGGIIVNNNLYAEGTEDNPITIKGLETGNQGITILNAQELKMDHILVSNLEPLSYQGWNTKAGISIYESKCHIYNLKLNAGGGDMALHFIRSNCQLNQITLSNQSKKGIQMDYCQGSINTITFEDVKDVCLKLKGSHLTLSNLKTVNCKLVGQLLGESALEVESSSFWELGKRWYKGEQSKLIYQEHSY